MEGVMILYCIHTRVSLSLSLSSVNYSVIINVNNTQNNVCGDVVVVEEGW
jgi:hypothetical protein